MNETRVAIVAEGRSYTYGDLDVASRRVAAALLGGRDDLGQARVAFFVRPGFDTEARDADAVLLARALNAPSPQGSV